MENKVAKAISKGHRISPFRTRLVIDLIRGKDVKEAKNILKNLNKKASLLVLKTLESAIANGVNNHSLELEKLYVKEARVDEGPVYKRIKFDSRGRVGRKDHKTSHIVIVVEER